MATAVQTGTRPAAPAAAVLIAVLGQATAQAAAAVVHAHRIDDWRAVSDTEIVITTNRGGRYRALLRAPCPGLRFTDRIAFVTRGEREIDRFAGIQLPDGTRCLFKSFGALPRPADSAAQSATKQRR